MTMILVPPELEKPLLEAASRLGQDPETFVVNRLREVLNVPEIQAGSSLFDLLEGYVGTVEGTGEAFSERTTERYADSLLEKKKLGRL
jgi:hypothetical protein